MNPIERLDAAIIGVRTLSPLEPWPEEVRELINAAVAASNDHQAMFAPGTIAYVEPPVVLCGNCQYEHVNGFGDRFCRRHAPLFLPGSGAEAHWPRLPIRPPGAVDDDSGCGEGAPRPEPEVAGGRP